MARRRVAVLISGRGSNLEALLAASRHGESAFSIELVLANEPTAAGIDRGRRAGVPVAVVPHRAFPSRAAFEAELTRRIEAAGADLVCLAGFMRLFTAGFVERWRDRLLNIHPSLLPAFPGLDTHARALAAGARVAGCTVHLVRTEVDAGPILVQGIVPVLPGDTAASLGARVLEVEHRAYPLAVGLLAAGRLVVAGERVEAVDSALEHRRLVVHPALADLLDGWDRTRPRGGR
jgi:phosphoribosylglycinamide formyltransferase-1